MRSTIIALATFAVGLVAAPVYAQTTTPETDATVSAAPDLPKLDAPANPNDIIKVEPKDDPAAIEAAQAAETIDPPTTSTTLGGAMAPGTPDGGAVDTTGMSTSAAAAASSDTPSEGIVPGQDANN